MESVTDLRPCVLTEKMHFANFSPCSQFCQLNLSPLNALNKHFYFNSRYIRRRRKVWVRPGRTDTWWQNLLSGKLPEDEWKLNLRMNRQDFNELVSVIAPFWRERSDVVRKDILSLDILSTVRQFAITMDFSLMLKSNGLGVSTMRGCLQIQK